MLLQTLYILENLTHNLSKYLSDILSLFCGHSILYKQGTNISPYWCLTLYDKNCEIKRNSSYFDERKMSTKIIDVKHVACKGKNKTLAPSCWNINTCISAETKYIYNSWNTNTSTSADKVKEQTMQRYDEDM